MNRLEVLVRSLLFNLAFLFWVTVPTVLCVWIVVLKQEYVFRAVYYWQSGLGWLERKILKLDYKIVGAENVPEGTCIIASKHQSAWETCKLNILFENPAIVLKKELTYVPIWGWYARASGLIPIDRKGRAKSLNAMKRAAERAKEAGRKIVIFPQGTRVRPGHRKPYKSGVVALYKDLGLPVVPMAVNSGLFWPKGSFIKEPGTITIKFLPPIPPGLKRAEFMDTLERQLETESDKLAGKA